MVVSILLPTVKLNGKPCHVTRNDVKVAVSGSQVNDPVGIVPAPVKLIVYVT